MIRCFRMVAGPNGSGKSTLIACLERNRSVNFSTMLNAWEIVAEVRRTHAFLVPFPIDGASLVAYAERTECAEEEKTRFRLGEISVDTDHVRFLSEAAVNSSTITLLVNFLQDECINRGVSFSQESAFSDLSKVAALAKAHNAGFSTFLYFVATEDSGINESRVAERYAQGGHDVPPNIIAERYTRSLANLPNALPHLSRAFFFDNSGAEMKYIARFSVETGIETLLTENEIPAWFRNFRRIVSPT